MRLPSNCISSNPLHLNQVRLAELLGSAKLLFRGRFYFEKLFRAAAVFLLVSVVSGTPLSRAIQLTCARNSSLLT